MKAISICEPSCNGRIKKDESPEVESNKESMKAMDTSGAADDDALSDIEICEVISNVTSSDAGGRQNLQESVKDEVEGCRRNIESGGDAAEQDDRAVLDASTLEPYISIEENCNNFDSAISIFDSCDPGIVENGEQNIAGNEPTDVEDVGEKALPASEKDQAITAGVLSETKDTNICDVQFNKSRFIDEILIDEEDEEEEEDKENRRTAEESVSSTVREDESVDQCKNVVLETTWGCGERGEVDDAEENNEEDDCIIANGCNDEERERDEGCVEDNKPENGVFDEDSKLEMETEEHGEGSGENDMEKRKRKVLDDSEEACVKKRKTSEDDSNSNSNDPGAFLGKSLVSRS